MTRVLAVIPARGGSKRLKRKNLRLLGGKPLIVWTIDAARHASTPDRIIVSSDDSEIRQVAKQAGADVPFIRPARLAKDETPGVDPILHATRELPGYDVVIVLQPTSPLRSSADIDGCAGAVLEGDAGGAVSVQRVEKPPQWIYRLDASGTLRPFMDEEEVSRRQEVSDLYRLNGAVYVICREVLLKEESLIPGRCSGYVMPPERSVDIDTEFDLAFAEFLLGKGEAMVSSRQ